MWFWVLLRGFQGWRIPSLGRKGQSFRAGSHWSPQTPVSSTLSVADRVGVCALTVGSGLCARAGGLGWAPREGAQPLHGQQGCECSSPEHRQSTALGSASSIPAQRELQALARSGISHVEPPPTFCSPWHIGFLKALWQFRGLLAPEKRKMICTMLLKKHSLNLKKDGFFILFGWTPPAL